MILSLDKIMDQSRKSIKIDCNEKLKEEVWTGIHFYFTSDPHVEGSIRQVDHRLQVEAYVTCSFEVPCANCLRSVPFHLDRVVTECCLVNDKSEYDEEMDSIVITDNTIDTIDILKLAMVNNLPYKVLCQEDCLGLCQRCGGDRNLNECSCEDADARESDARLSVLQQLKNKL